MTTVQYGDENYLKVNQEQAGGNFISSLYKASKFPQTITKRVLRKTPNVVKKLIELKGNMKVISVQACKTPIQSGVKKALDLMTFGKFSANQKRMEYDDVVHLYLIMRFEDGSAYSIEKNELVKVYKNPKPRADSRCSKIQRTDFTFQTMMERGQSKGGRNFYRYFPRTDNCQKFLKDLLEGNGITQLTPFIMANDGKELFRGTPPKLQSFLSTITDVGNLSQKILFGAGK